VKTRADLEQGIFSWLHRAALRSPIPGFEAVPTFITLAEDEINLDLRARCMVQRVVQPVDSHYMPLPCDYVEAIDLRLGENSQGWGGRELTYAPRRDMGARMQGNGVHAYVMTDPRSTAYAWPGGPCNYCIVGDTIELMPRPPDPLPAGWIPYTVEMSYYARQELGPDPDDTTAVLTTYPAIYLFGALVKSAPFLRDDERAAGWLATYQGLIFRANAEHERARTQGSRIVQRYRRIA
jgi:hypothetical protein